MHTMKPRKDPINPRGDPKSERRQYIAEIMRLKAELNRAKDSFMALWMAMDEALMVAHMRWFKKKYGGKSKARK